MIATHPQPSRETPPLELQHPPSTTPASQLDPATTTTTTTVPSSLSPTLLASQIPNLPPSFHYLPSFLTPAEEIALLATINTHPWTHLTHRKLQAHPGPLSPAGTLLSAPLPAFLTPLAARLVALGIFDDLDDPSDPSPSITTDSSPNHVLINAYLPSQGIFPHEDGPAYHPVVATISLGSSVVLDVSPPGARIWLPPRSLLVTRGQAYRGRLHGIAAVDVDEDLGPGTVANWRLLGDEERKEVERGGGTVRREGERVSLTFRRVRRVRKVGRGVLAGLVGVGSK